MRRKPYWTRRRMIDAGANFFRRHGIAPTNEDWWNTLTQFTADTATGATTQGSKRPYPSTGPLKQVWRGMRAFWEDVRAAYPDLDIRIDAGDMPWSPLEEWFITESVGLIPRKEVSELMGRTEPAIKRRLYEMGVNTYNRWGWTLNHVQRVTGVSAATVKHYIDHGKLPFFQGHKCIYVEPADLLVIEEYNWAKKRHPQELEDAVRRSLIERLCYILLRFDRRRYSYHQIRPLKAFYTGRIKQPRKRSMPLEPKPSHIRVGDWARAAGEYALYPGAAGRTGRVKAIVWSPQHRRRTSKSPERPPCWVVTIEFRKQRPPGRPELRRTRINVPARHVEKARKPYERKKPLRPRGRRTSAGRKTRMKSLGERVLDNRLRLQPDLHEPVKPA